MYSVAPFDRGCNDQVACKLAPVPAFGLSQVNEYELVTGFYVTSLVRLATFLPIFSSRDWNHQAIDGDSLWRQQSFLDPSMDLMEPRNRSNCSTSERKLAIK